MLLRKEQFRGEMTFNGIKDFVCAFNIEEKFKKEFGEGVENFTFKDIGEFECIEILLDNEDGLYSCDFIEDYFTEGYYVIKKYAQKSEV